MRTRDLTLMAGARCLVRQLSWQAQAGECWCILGKNGAGKSTLLRILAGLIDGQVGDVELKGRKLNAWPIAELARERAYLPQSRSDAFSFSVLDTVLAARHPYHGNRYWESDVDYDIALRALEALDVAQFAERDLRSLSGGERQRVAIAAVLAQDTPYLLLDEPTNALDLSHQIEVMRLLGQLTKERRRCILLVSHDLNLIELAVTHALLLHDDGTWEAGRIEEVLTAPKLSQCLGHAVHSIKHEGRTVYLPTW